MKHNADERHNFADGLRAARKNAGLTQGQLAARSGIDRATISLIENGREAPRADTILKLAEALHLSPARLWSHAPFSYSSERTGHSEHLKEKGTAAQGGAAGAVADSTGLTYEPLGTAQIHPGLRELLESDRDRLLLGITSEEEAMLRSIRTRNTGNLSREFFIDVLIAYRRHHRSKSGRP